MNEIWRRWAALMKAECPAKFAQLAGPALPQHVAEVEELLGLSLPDDYRQLLFIHNGGPILLQGYFLCSTAEIARRWKFWNFFPDFEPEIEDHSFVKRMPFNPRWIPLATDSESQFCIDLDPDKGGTVGQVFYHHYEVGPQQVYAASLRSFVENFVSLWEQKIFRTKPGEEFLVGPTNFIRDLMVRS